MDWFLSDNGHRHERVNGEETVEAFYEKELEKINQEEFKIEKVIKRKGDNCMSNRKAMIIHLLLH